MKRRALLPAMKRCPRCGTSKPQFEPLDGRSEWVRCSTVVSHYPYVEHECDFSAPRNTLHIPFVRIGASGLPCFGQSTWNFVSHGRMWNSGSLLGNSFSRLDWWQGNSAADIQYERQLTGVGSSATGPGRSDAYWTLTSSPGLFGRRRNFILSVEDWAGEWISHGISLEDGDARLVECDAFVLFMAPKRSFEDWQDHAMPAFDKFLSQLKKHRRAMKQSVDVPVAIAIPMLDFILKDVPAEIFSRAERLIHEIKNSGPINEATTLASIKRRHELVMELSRGLMPLPRFISLCESVVGPKRVFAFPMATFGWGESPKELLASLGPEKAHQYLTTHSFGVLDPILWALHALGLRRLPTG